MFPLSAAVRWRRCVTGDRAGLMLHRVAQAASQRRSPGALAGEDDQLGADAYIDEMPIRLGAVAPDLRTRRCVVLTVSPLTEALRTTIVIRSVTGGLSMWSTADVPPPDRCGTSSRGGHPAPFRLVRHDRYQRCGSAPSRPEGRLTWLPASVLVLSSWPSRSLVGSLTRG